MGQRINITYIGAFIKTENFLEHRLSDDFYDEFVDKGMFKLPYESLKNSEVLIPAISDFSFCNENSVFDDFIFFDMEKLKTLELMLKEKYSDVLTKLKQMYPDSDFEIVSGVIHYSDEFA